LLPTKVTEVGRKCAGGGAPEVVVDSVLRGGCWIWVLFLALGVALLDCTLWLALARTETGVVAPANG
jgi:hypothetical protein